MSLHFVPTNTAILLTAGPFMQTDGLTLATTLTITNERISLTAETYTGSAPAYILDNITGATSGTSNDLNYITGGDNAMMQIELSAANLNRFGFLRLTITDAANHVPVWEDIIVLPTVVWNWFFGNSGVPAVNATQFAGQTITAAAGVTLPTSVASPTNITAGTMTTVTSVTNAPTVGDFTATMKTSIGTAVAASAVASVTGAVGSVTGGVGGSVAGSVNSVVNVVSANIVEVNGQAVTGTGEAGDRWGPA